VVIASPTNEIQQNINTQYLSVAKGVDSLLSFKKHTEWLPVTRLLLHLPRQHNFIFNEMKIWPLWWSVLPTREPP
jgi:hypothetical protein